MLTENAARWLLVLHTALGVAAVGAATHLVLWMREYRHGKFGRHRAVRRFAWIAFALHAAGFFAGNVMYPTYKVEVRTAYLENAGAIVEDGVQRQRALDKIAAREGAAAPQLTPSREAVKGASKIARWFDVKEHWIALGLFGSAALVLTLTFWDPRKDGAALVPVTFGLAVVIAGTLWLGAIVGILTSAWRAV